MAPEYSAALFGLVGVIVGAIASTATQAIIQHAETKRMLQREFIRGGLAQWQQFFNAIKHKMNNTGPLSPPEAFVFNLILLYPLLTKAEGLSTEKLAAQLRAHLRKIDLITHIYEEHATADKGRPPCGNP